MRIYLGADHRGLQLKEQVSAWLTGRDIEICDLGAYEPTPDDDYNDYAIAVAHKVVEDRGSFGVLLCASAQGMCMQANRFKGIRAAFCRTIAEAAETRSHNDANILCLSADEDYGAFGEILDSFLKTSFLPYERYIRRNQKLDEV